MILAAHQPQFAPWLGFFDKLDRADVFVLLDNVQFKKNEWQNRNRIKGAGGAQWLTVPVSFRLGQRINEVAISHRQNWPRRQLASLRSCYGRAAHFEPVLARYEDLLCGRRWEGISELNVALLGALTRCLRISTRVVLASELDGRHEDPDLRLIGLCRELQADTYLAGAGGRAYMNLERYRTAGIRVIFQEYHHPVYPQLFGGFEPALSVLDLLFNCGPRSLNVIRGRFASEDEEDYEHTGHRRSSG